MNSPKNIQLEQKHKYFLQKSSTDGKKLWRNVIGFDMKFAEFKTFIKKRGRMLVIMFILIVLKLKVKLIFVFVMKTDLI